MNLLAEQDATVTLTNGDDCTTHGLYTSEGFQMVSNLWIKAAVNQNLNHQAHWFGRRIIQFPTDILVMQELLWAIKPDLVIEAGIADGGSLGMFASVLDAIGHGHAIGIDAHLKPPEDMHERVSLISGRSTDEDVLADVRHRAKDAKCVMVFLDSAHDADHVSRELEAYAPLVTPGSYLVCQDGAQAWVWETPMHGNPDWKHNHPLRAIEDFLAEHPEFEVDESMTRFGITSSPSGYLRKAL